MTTQTDIVQDCLEHLGENASTGSADTTQWVTRINAAYPREVKKLLEGHTWNFSLATSQLAAVDPTPEGWLYGFTKPAACKRIVKVAASNDPKANSIDYVDFGGRILTNSETTFLTRVDGTVFDTPAMWPELFAGACGAQIAWKICPVTGTGDTRKEELRKTAKRALSSAKLWDAQQNGPWPIPPGAYELARGGISRRYNG